MKAIKIDLELIKKLGININEYLVLYDIANEMEISAVFDYGMKELVSLEKKALLKLTDGEIYLRGKANGIFSSKEDLFDQWIGLYPTTVKKNGGGSRALSPASSDTILGVKLRKKWDLIFKKDIEKQMFAIKVLVAEVVDKKKSGDLEYMVEAARWLNEGFFEKFAHLVKDDDVANEDYSSEDWL
jgi:hypothetical protein